MTEDEKISQEIEAATFDQELRLEIIKMVFDSCDNLWADDAFLNRAIRIYTWVTSGCYK